MPRTSPTSAPAPLLEEEQEPVPWVQGPAPAFLPHSPNHPPPTCILRRGIFSPSDKALEGQAAANGRAH